MLTYNDICDLSCLSNHNSTIDDIIENTRSNIHNEFILPFNCDSHYITYAPVGNYPDNPIIIISGKTTSGDSSDKFKDYLLEGLTLHEACIKSIYSNMKDNLFLYLYEIGLFDYLKKHIDYWNTTDYKSKWDDIFISLEHSMQSGIQLTQAFNCAILNHDTKKRSAQPSNKIFNKIQNNYGCMFKHFRITKYLKLIIFLDTPVTKSSFHQIDYWNRYYKSIFDCKIISITHPSAQNSVIFNNLNNLANLDNNKKYNAIKLLNIAKKTINEL